jgi:hypothetical protein
LQTKGRCPRAHTPRAHTGAVSCVLERGDRHRGLARARSRGRRPRRRLEALPGAPRAAGGTDVVTKRRREGRSVRLPKRCARNVSANWPARTREGVPGLLGRAGLSHARPLPTWNDGTRPASIAGRCLAPTGPPDTSPTKTEPRGSFFRGFFRNRLRSPSRNSTTNVRRPSVTVKRCLQLRSPTRDDVSLCASAVHGRCCAMGCSMSSSSVSLRSWSAPACACSRRTPSDCLSLRPVFALAPPRRPARRAGRTRAGGERGPGGTSRPGACRGAASTPG